MRLSALIVSVLPALWALPTPEDHFGHSMGADRELVEWEDVVSYFRSLDEASDSLSVEELGRSTEGRPLILAVIANAETIADLDRYRGILASLADPRKTPPDMTDQLVAEGKARGCDHVLDPRDGSGLDHDGGAIRIRPAFKRHPPPRHHPGQHDPPAGALAQSGRRG